MKRTVDIALLRDYLDDTAADAPMNATGDVNWSDEDLRKALDSAAREFNSLPPLIGGHCDSSNLPADTNMFLDGAGAYAIERWLRRKQRERAPFTAGGIDTDPDKPLIDEMTKLSMEMRTRFTRAATTLKATRNMNMCYDQIG